MSIQPNTPVVVTFTGVVVDKVERLCGGCDQLHEVYIVDLNNGVRAEVFAEDVRPEVMQ